MAQIQGRAGMWSLHGVYMHTYPLFYDLQKLGFAPHQLEQDVGVGI